MKTALVTLFVVVAIVAIIMWAIFRRIFLIYEGKSKKTVVTLDNKVLMPSGMEAPSDTDMLNPQMVWADALQRSDLSWVINYIGHQVDGCKDPALKQKWHEAFVFFSSIKNQKGWWV